MIYTYMSHSGIRSVVIRNFRVIRVLFLITLKIFSYTSFTQI